MSGVPHVPPLSRIRLARIVTLREDFRVGTAARTQHVLVDSRDEMEDGAKRGNVQAMSCLVLFGRPGRVKEREIPHVETTGAASRLDESASNHNCTGLPMDADLVNLGRVPLLERDAGHDDI